MPRAKSKSKNQGSSHLELNPIWIKVAIWGVVSLVAILGVCYFESLNRHVQLDRKLERDPRIAEWYTAAKSTAEGANESTSDLQLAVWFGEIDRLPEPKSIGEPTLVDLIRPRLMAGEKSKRGGSSRLSIRTRNQEFSKQRPQKGDQWVFLVSRDKAGANHLQSAACYRRAGS